MYAPVVLFVYNREEHSRLVLEALKRNQGAEKTDLFIYSDAAKSENEREAVGKVRKYIRQISSENSFRSVTVIEAKENKGLAKSIIGGVTDVINKYGKVIVLEDDHITAPDFLTYMNSGLDFYEKNTQIWSISGYTWKMKGFSMYLWDIVHRAGDGQAGKTGGKKLNGICRIFRNLCWISRRKSDLIGAVWI